MPQDKKKISFRLSQEDFQIIKKVAKAKRIPVSSFVRMTAVTEAERILNSA